MLRRALTPRWLGWSLLAVLLSVAFVLLGQWQWGRYEDKQARADRVEAHYTAAPVPVSDVVGTDPLPLAREWTRVTATGRYDAERTVLVRNRPRDGSYGYEVLVPLRLEDGSTLVVDRGWVPNSPKGAEVRPEVPAPPAGEVTVTGWVKPGEATLDRQMPQDLVASIHLPEVAPRVGGEVLGGYAVLQSEDPSAERPASLDEPDTGIGPHMAYAIQWWLGIPAVWTYLWLALRRESRAASGEPVAARPKKVRVWDEEDG